MKVNLKRRSLLAATAALPMLGAGKAAWADKKEWPARSVTIIVPGSAGGTADALTRIMAKAWEERAKESFIVLFKPGSGGIIGAQAALRSAADGYTLFQGSTSTHAINFSIYKEPGYGPDDFIPLTDMVSFPNVVVVNSKSPYHSFAELIDAQRKAPGKLFFGSGGTGQTSHLGVEIVNVRTNTKAIHVPYKGGAPTIVALMGGEIDYMMQNATLTMPHIQSGDFRALAVTSAERLPQLPDVPTLSESGLDGLVISGWLGYFLRAGTPSSIVASIREQIYAVMHDRAVIDRYTAMGAVPGGKKPEEFARFVDAERKMWNDAIRLSGLEKI